MYWQTFKFGLGRFFEAKIELSTHSELLGKTSRAK